MIRDQETIIRELKEKFDRTKRELNFKASYSDVEEIFFIEDAVLSVGFVSERFSRQLSHRIADTYTSWLSYLHNLVLPNPSYLIHMNESKMLSQEDKNTIGKMISEIMALVSVNTLLGVNRNNDIEGKFIDDSVEFWKQSFRPFVTDLMQKIGDGWKKS